MKFKILEGEVFIMNMEQKPHKCETSCLKRYVKNSNTSCLIIVILRKAAVVRDCVLIAAMEPNLYPVQCRVLLFRTLLVQSMASVGSSSKGKVLKRQANVREIRKIARERGLLTSSKFYLNKEQFMGEFYVSFHFSSILFSKVRTSKQGVKMLVHQPFP